MEHIVELWNTVFEWLGTGKKVIMGILFLVAGTIVNVIWQPPGGLTHSSFLLFMVGMLFLVNALFSKLLKCNINVLCYILVFVVILELGVALMEDMKNITNIISIWGPCFLFVWALQYVVLQAADMEGIAKRIVIAFLDTVAGAAAIVAAFMIPIWLKMGGSL